MGGDGEREWVSLKEREREESSSLPLAVGRKEV